MFSWIGRLDIIDFHSSQWSTDSTQSQSKFQQAYFSEINKITLKFIWKGTGTVAIMAKNN